jgi:malate dehydrogenase (oxaloacetate-decarboxylating)(NADP+)
MKPVFDRAKADLKRVVYAEGEEDTILRAVQHLVDENMARPILIGRPAVIERRIQRLKLRIRAGEHFELCNVDDDPRYHEYWNLYLSLNERRGVTPALAKALVRSRPRLIAAIVLQRGEAEAMISGIGGRYTAQVGDVLSAAAGSRRFAPVAMTAAQNDGGTFFFIDTHVQNEPSAERIAEATCQAVPRLKLSASRRRSLPSHLELGQLTKPSAQMRRAFELARTQQPLEIDTVDADDSALNEETRRIFPTSAACAGQANVSYSRIDAAKSL